jgi:hypothetical protein
MDMEWREKAAPWEEACSGRARSAARHNIRFDPRQQSASPKRYRERHAAIRGAQSGLQLAPPVA